MSNKHNLYSTACAYIEYYGADELDGVFEDESIEDTEHIKETKSRLLGKFALWPEAAYARFRLRIRAEAIGADSSPEGLLGLAADIKKDTEDDLYGNLPMAGSTHKRELMREKLDDLDQGRYNPSVDLAIHQILRRADEDSTRADAALDVRGYGSKAVSSNAKPIN